MPSQLQQAFVLAASDIIACCSAVLAHYLLNEKLNLFGLLGGMLCVAGSLTIVLHAPEERPITSLLQVWQLALQPGIFVSSCMCPLWQGSVEF